MKQKIPAVLAWAVLYDADDLPLRKRKLGAVAVYVDATGQMVVDDTEMRQLLRPRSGEEVEITGADAWGRAYAAQAQEATP